MKKTLEFIKKNKIIVGIIVIILIAVGYFVLRNPKEVQRDFVTVARTNVIQEVDVTGRVEPAKEVELAIQSGGKVSAVNVSVGQKVNAGQTLVSVNTSDLYVRLERQKAALEKAKIVLTKAEPKTNASDDLVKAYEDGFNTVADAFLDLPTIITDIDDILSHSYLSNNNLLSLPDAARDFRSDAELKYYAAEDAYDETFKNYKNATRDSDRATIEDLIDETYKTTRMIADAVKSINNLIDYIENKTDEESIPEELDTDKTTLAEYTTQTNTHLTDLLAIQDTINDSREGITDENYDIESIKIDIRQAELDIQDTLVQIGNRSIHAPISGIITDVMTEVGETISSGNPVVSLISSNQYQIEANLPESDMAKVKVNADAEVTLDAYGSDVVFIAKVVSINPAETLIDGVATYKTTLQFTDTDDRIKPGMTADLEIKGERKDNVFAIPQRAIVTRDGIKYVQILEGDVVVEKVVQTGLRGTDGNVEIIDGLNEGDKVIVFIEEK